MKALALLLLAGAASAQGFASSTCDVPGSNRRLALLDLDGDGRRDLLSIDVEGFGLRRLRADGTYPGEDDSRLAWPAPTTGWAIADMDGDGRSEILLLVEGRRVVVVRPDAQGALAAGAPLLDQPLGFLPRGVRRVNFVRDVDGDGRLDLVLPGEGRFLIHRNLGAEGFAPALAVTCRADIGLELGDPSRLDARFSQDMQVPWFGLQDLDGDGHMDLVSETTDSVQAHLATPDLPLQPTWTLDLAALRAEMPARQKVDLDNLLGNIDPQINWRAADLDGVPPGDVVLQTGGTFRVYLGGGKGPRIEQPDQVLKASGNVLYFLLKDVDGDGRPDLQVLRAASVSIGEVIRMVAFPSTHDFDVFTYLNVHGAPGAERGEVFARRPTSRTTVALHLPALLTLFSEMDEMKEDYDKRRAVPAASACLDGDGVENDVVDLQGDKLAIWKDAAPPDFQPGTIERLRSFDVDALLQEYVTSELDDLGDGGRLEITLDDIKDMLVTPGWDLREAVKGKAPTTTLPLDVPLASVRIRTEDLDGDGRDDIIVSAKPVGAPRRVQFLVGRKE